MAAKATKPTIIVSWRKMSTLSVLWERSNFTGVRFVVELFFFLLLEPRLVEEEVTLLFLFFVTILYKENI